MEISLTHIDTACCLLELPGCRILTDPVLDPAGRYYHHGFGAFSKKTFEPAYRPEDLQGIDLVLLSHPQHKDNFDRKGREFAKTVPLVLSTPRIKKQLPNGQGLRPWETHTHALPGGERLKITATPAQHHPGWLPKFFSGHVIGFVLEHSAAGQAIYITGDTVFFPGIAEVARRFPRIGLALVHVGSAEFRYLTGWGKYTMAAAGFVKTVEAIGPEVAIPIHNGGWTHFKEGDVGVKAALPPEMGEKVVFLERGVARSFSLA